VVFNGRTAPIRDTTGIKISPRLRNGRGGEFRTRADVGPVTFAGAPTHARRGRAPDDRPAVMPRHNSRRPPRWTPARWRRESPGRASVLAEDRANSARTRRFQLGARSGLWCHHRVERSSSRRPRPHRATPERRYRISGARADRPRLNGITGAVGLALTPDRSVSRRVAGRKRRSVDLGVGPTPDDEQPSSIWRAHGGQHPHGRRLESPPPSRRWRAPPASDGTMRSVTAAFPTRPRADRRFGRVVPREQRGGGTRPSTRRRACSPRSWRTAAEASPDARRRVASAPSSASDWWRPPARREQRR